MGKAIRGLSRAPALTPEPARGPRSRGPVAAEPIGAYLARQRQLRGIELDELALATRIPRRSLERLEAGAFDAHPDGFARGFVRTVAQALGLDAADTVARMLPEAELRPRSGMPHIRRAVAVLLVLAAGAGLSLGAWTLARGLSARRPAAEDTPPPVRRDALRALAVAEGLEPPDAVRRPRPLAPVARPAPAEPPAPDEAPAPPAE